jgi:hypothetical protein
MGSPSVTRAGLGVLLLSAALVVPGSRAYSDQDTKEHDQDDICYAWDIFPAERFRLDVRKHSRLSTAQEERVFQHPRQTAYRVNGKHVIFDIIAAVDGTVVVGATSSASRRIGPDGAHMGLHSIFVRGAGVFDFARPVTVDCTTEEADATPNVWHCQSRNEFDIYHGFSTLTRVDVRADALCSVFEDGAVVRGGTGIRSLALPGAASVGRK